MPASIHFVLAANNLSSQTRVVVEFANALANRGCRVIVSVPYFNFSDFAVWQLRRRMSQAGSWIQKGRLWCGFLVPLMRSLGRRQAWYGQTVHALDLRVRVRRFWTVPVPARFPKADWIIAFQPYLLRRLREGTSFQGRVMGSIRLDFLAGSRDPDPEVAQWREFCISAYRTQGQKVPLFAVSQRARDSAVSLGIPVQGVIQNGINLHEFTDGQRRGDPDRLRITLFTNDHPQKGQDWGCSVVRKLRQVPLQRPLEVIAVGGKVKEGYRELFDDCRGYLTGRSYVETLQQTDIFLFPTLYEGFPAVPLEALACGCALVTTQVSGIEEYAVHGKNALLCRPGDEEAMLENVLRLICDVPFRDALREAGVRTAQRYSWGGAAQALLEFLEEPHDSKR